MEKQKTLGSGTMPKSESIFYSPELGSSLMMASRANTFPQQPPNIRETIIPTFNHMGTVAYAAAAAVDNQLSFVSSSILYRSWVALEGTSNPSLKRDGEGVRSGAFRPPPDVQWFVSKVVSVASLVIVPSLILFLSRLCRGQEPEIRG